MSSPNWLDLSDYPFAPRYLATDRGQLHYVDEGQGSTVVMVHGTPTWSYLYRHLIKGLSGSHRCIAMDHLGFGLSDKPATPLHLHEHAENVKRLIESLDLRDITLVVHDFGGPIGLSYALQKPENVKRLVLFNTWMWSVEGDPHFARPAKLLSGRLGRFLYERCNFAVNVMMKHVSKSRISEAAYRHYRGPLSTPADRAATWQFAKELISASDWLASLAKQKDKISAKPALVLWGAKDGALPFKMVQNWSLLLTNAEIKSLPDAGHFVPEEKGMELAPVIAQFIATHL